MTQMSINKINTQIVIHSYSGHHPAMKKPNTVHDNMDEPHRCNAGQKEHDTKEHILWLNFYQVQEQAELIKGT